MKNVNTLIALAGFSLLAACGSAKKTATTTTPVTTGTFSISWTNNGCTSCHGARGVNPTSASTPKLLGSKSNTEAKFVALLRAGVTGTAMSPYSAASYPDADLKADYKVLGGL